MFRQKERKKSITVKSDYLNTALQEQQKKVLDKEKRKYISLIVFYLFTSLELVNDGIKCMETDFTKGMILIIGCIIGLVIPVVYHFTRSQRWANIATMVYLIPLSILRLLVGAFGLLGIVDVIVGVIWIFGFMDINFAAALNYILLLARFLLFTRIIDVPGMVNYEPDVIIWYLSSNAVAAISVHWFEFRLHQISTYRDRMLQIALGYCNGLEEANLAKSQFLSNMSHDIRTPMNAIAGYAAIAKEHMDDRNRVQDCLDKIEISEKYLGEIINAVLDMSRIETGKESLRKEIVSLSRFSKDVAAIIMPVMEKKRIHLVHSESVKHVTVITDGVKLRRIMINILSNAVKYTGEDGTIICRLSEEESSKAGCGIYTFYVEDNGIGMSKEYLQHIFEPFSREQTEMSEKNTGTGLGMSIAKKYVEFLGGSIHVESEQGVGTKITVTLELPWTEEEERKLSDEMSSDFLKGKHTLYVDDSKMNREIVTMMLEDFGVNVMTATNGAEAVDILSSCEDNAYDFILMDIRMPVMGGIEATKQIRAMEREYLKKVPIIAVTANAFTEDEEACLQAGMNGHVSKPFTIEELLKEIYKAI